MISDKIFPGVILLMVILFIIASAISITINLDKYNTFDCTHSNYCYRIK